MNTEQAIKRLTQLAADEVLTPRAFHISRKVTAYSRKVMCHLQQRAQNLDFFRSVYHI